MVRHIDVRTATVTTLVGKYNLAGNVDGVGTNARLGQPYGVQFADYARIAYVADSQYGMLKRIDVASGTLATIAGSGSSSTPIDGVGTYARFFAPRGIATNDSV